MDAPNDCKRVQVAHGSVVVISFHAECVKVSRYSTHNHRYARWRQSEVGVKQYPAAVDTKRLV